MAQHTDYAVVMLFRFYIVFIMYNVDRLISQFALQQSGSVQQIVFRLNVCNVCSMLDGSF